jgi:hypothetical protein
MAEPIGPGDWVECVDASPRHHAHPIMLQACALLRRGKIYCVRDVGQRVGYTGGVGLLLVGLIAPNEDDGYGWAADRFRLVYRPNERLTADLLTQVPADDLVSA